MNDKLSCCCCEKSWGLLVIVRYMSYICEADLLLIRFSHKEVDFFSKWWKASLEGPVPTYVLFRESTEQFPALHFGLSEFHF